MDDPSGSLRHVYASNMLNSERLYMRFKDVAILDGESLE